MINGDHPPLEHGSLYIDDIKYSADGRIGRAGDYDASPKVLLYLLRGLYFITSVTSHPADRVPGSPGALYHASTEPPGGRGKAPH